jgi:outer membrane protein OmpA-like peptidoglycan-associated protein
MMNENPKYLAHVEGHTNNLPSDDYAERLSKARADAVITKLVEKGIDYQRLTRKALGKKQVISKEKDHSHRKLNQRVEVKLMVRQE